MRKLPFIDEYVQVSREVIWFEEPDVALANPVRFATYAMTYGSTENMAALMNYYTDDELRHVLENAPPGIMDERSWNYWHLMLGVSPTPPMPVRSFD